jgi:O-antigen ligase
MLGFLIVLSAAAVPMTQELGWRALAMPVLVGSVILAVASPWRLGVILLGAAIALEPGAIDASGEVAVLLYELPPGVELPLTISPLEIAMCIALLSAVARSWQRVPRLPVVAALIPLTIALGFVHGWRSGGEMNIGYNEARGLIYGTAAFGLALLSPRGMLWELRNVLVVTTTVLGAIVVYRYLAIVRTNQLDVPIEFAFAHENSIFLGAGLVYGLTWLARPSLSLTERIFLICYVLLMFVALAATQRRAATLVALVGILTVGTLLLTRRPVFVITAAVPLILLSSLFLAATWNREYGALAQPARAIRSQIDPSPRDESSDLYRDIERSNVIETVRGNRLLGVGFGRPFAQFQALPNLEAHWPLQSFTPHQNVLWLWLKMGVVGLAAFLATVSLALGRAMTLARRDRQVSAEVGLGIVLAATILMYLAFATVDLALIGTRGAIPLALALGIAFQIRRSSRESAEARDE